MAAKIPVAPDMPPVVIFTDLDGTLLDHDTYDWAPAAALLKRLTQADIPVCLASSKTASEMGRLRSDMGLSAFPFICENGAGLVTGEFDENGLDRSVYTKLRDQVNALPPRLRDPFEGFGDMGPQRIAAVTGLSRAASEAAAARMFSEPGLWSGDDARQSAFLDALAPHGITGRRGGRFLTLSYGGTKADRMAEIAANYGAPMTIALGDAPNDREMLEQADYGLIIPNPHGARLSDLPGEVEGRIRRASLPGPTGWSTALSDLLSTLNVTI